MTQALPPANPRGGREGYQSLLNTNMSLELDNLARCADESRTLCVYVNAKSGSLYLWMQRSYWSFGKSKVFSLFASSTLAAPAAARSPDADAGPRLLAPARSPTNCNNKPPQLHAHGI